MSIPQTLYFAVRERSWIHDLIDGIDMKCISPHGFLQTIVIIGVMHHFVENHTSLKWNRLSWSA